MKICYVNISDGGGGASRAAYRLYQGVKTLGVPTRMFVFDKTMDDADIFTPSGWVNRLMKRLRNYRMDTRPLRRYPPVEVYWSLNWVPYPVTSVLERPDYDLLHLHWIGNGFIPIRVLGKVTKPIVWTLHDEWAFTGGCHYAYDCEGFKTGCGACPQLRSSNTEDVSRRVWKNKNHHWQSLNLTLVTPSHWLAERVRQSALFAEKRVEVIPNGIDVQTYKPLDRNFARQALNLPLDKRLILFGGVASTHDKRKGFEQLQAALRKLAESGWSDRLELVVFGNTGQHSEDILGLKTHFLGRLNDETTLALTYSAADVFVAPSLQDNLPNTIMEALACGTPSVSFNIGGIPDLIEHQQNGYLAAPLDANDLAQGIEWALSDDERYHRLSVHAREKILAEFDLRHAARRYRALYEEMISQRKSH